MAAAAALLALAGIAAPATAQQRGQQPPAAAPAAPQTFGSWLRGCERSGRTEICSLRQLVAPTDSPRNPILAVAIGRLTSDRKMAMVFKLPVSINREAGIGFRIDESPVISIPVQGCDAGACTAAMTLDDEMQKRLRGGTKSVVMFRSPQGAAAVLPLSLQGLTRGLASLK
ncbi:invasion protein IalB [Stella humosa]|uniref:Invasion protein IalB n=2 Tax=Stella humosa TaxID=94 RepID=A0A3N1KJ43_9PROT|nr:invasion protein IalB [Stella humosa]BBK33356.1 hypothetical protein STHU_39900 [Stella humosa]